MQYSEPSYNTVNSFRVVSKSYFQSIVFIRELSVMFYILYLYYTILLYFILILILILFYTLY